MEEENELKNSTKKKLAKKDEELETAKADCEHWKNEYYRCYADMANLRKEIERDHKEAIKYRLEGFVDKIINVLDSFDMAFRVEPTNKETANYLSGFKYVHNSLLTILEEEGIQILDPKIGQKFDENTMHAVDTVESDSEEDTIHEVTIKGYKLHDHLIRPAMVIVNKKKVEKPAEENVDEVKKV